MTQTIIDILLVEDNMNDAELAVRELKKSNMANNLVHLHDGEEALAYIFATGKYAGRPAALPHPKLILLDIHMPKVNGIEVLERLKSDPSTSTIPVVILTSSKEDPDIKKCYMLGANSYIVKPVNFDRFRESIQNLGYYWLLLNQPPVG